MKVNRVYQILAAVMLIISFSVFIWSIEKRHQRRMAEHYKQRDIDVAACRAIGGFPIISGDRWRLERCER